MINKTKINTFNRQYILAFTLVCIIMYFLCLSISSRLLYKDAVQEVTHQTQQWASVLAFRSITYILSDDSSNLQNAFQVLDSVGFINNIIVYKAESNTDKLHYFASYDRQNRDGLTDVDEPFHLSRKTISATNITPLLSLRKKQNYLSLALPIKTQSDVNEPERVVGYLYIITNLTFEYANTTNVLIQLVGVGFIIVLILLFAVKVILHKITLPIDHIANTIGNISRQKDFSMRCPTMPYQEFDWLVQKINIMLSRIERHITKQTDAEKQIIDLNHQLEHKVSQRTDALKESNQELLSTLEKLHQYQNQLVESEKMASLGDMVAGVAHEVNTPIGLGVTASSLLYDKLYEIKQAFEQKTLKSSELKKFLNEGEEHIGIISRNLTRAADLISSFKKVAVDQSSEKNRRFDVKELLEEVKLTLAPKFKNTPYQIKLICPEPLLINSKPGPLNQVLVNLMMNSLIHGFENRDTGIISITVMTFGQQLQIIYTDDGNGVSESIKHKIFEPFITTKRGSGASGLGLHLVYNMVTQALQGSIHFESEQGKGVLFDITLPYEN